MPNDSPIQLLLLIDSFGGGGAERSTLELARYLTTLPDILPTVAALKHTEVGIEEAFRALPCRVTIGDTRNRRERLAFIEALLREVRPDIVHTALFETNLLTRLAWQKHRDFKLVQSLVNTPYVNVRDVGTGMARVKFALAKYADAVTARLTPTHYHSITRTVAEHYGPYFGAGARNADIIYRGRRPNPDLRIRTASDGAVRSFINVGRQDFQKGQFLILQAFRQLREQGLSDIHCDIYGKAGTETEALVRYQREEGVNQVRLHAFSDDINAVLARHDAFLFPSYFEGLGGALIEAMAAGLPCICSDIPVLREVVGDAAGALFFEPGNAGQLAAAVKRLHRDPELAGRLSAHSAARFESTFQLGAVSEQLADLYRRVHAVN